MEEACTLLRHSSASEFGIRPLASLLGVTPMALYRHVGDKRQLTGRVLDHLLMPLSPRQDCEPFEGLVAFMDDYVFVVINNAQAFLAFFSEPEVSSSEAGRISEQLVSLLQQAGKPAADAARIRDILIDHAHGHAISLACGTRTDAKRRAISDFSATSRFLMARLVGTPCDPFAVGNVPKVS